MRTKAWTTAGIVACPGKVLGLQKLCIWPAEGKSGSVRFTVLFLTTLT